VNGAETAAIAEVIPLQMFAYFMALERGVMWTGRGSVEGSGGAGGILIRVSWTGLDFITLHNSNSVRSGIQSGFDLLEASCPSFPGSRNAATRK